MASSTEICFINDLPDEILLQILSNLPLQDLLLGARQTCSRWLNLSRDDTLWVDVDLSSFSCGYEKADLETNSKGVRNLLYTIQGSVRKLTFGNLSVDGEVYQLFGTQWNLRGRPHFKNLKSLDFSYSRVGPRNLRVALTTNPDVEELSLICTNISFSQAMEEAMHLPSLKKFIYHDLLAWDNFLEHPQHTDRTMNKLAAMRVPKQCPSLEWVELHSLWANLDDEVIQQFTRCCSKLKRLSLTWSTFLSEDAFKYIDTSHHITSLSLCDRQDRGPYLNFVLPNFPHLLHLTVSGQDISLEDCIAIGECCPKLRELILEVNNIEESSRMFQFWLDRNSLCGLELQKIVKCCTDLRKLHVPYSNVDDKSIVFLSEQCPYLEDVNFMGCLRLSKDSLLTLSKNARHLKQVNFQGTDIHDRYLIGLLRNCVNLEQVVFDSRNDEKKNAVGQQLQSKQGDLKLVSEHALSRSISEGGDIPFIDMVASCESPDFQRESENASEMLEDFCLLQDLKDLPPHFHIPSVHCHIKSLSLRFSRADEILFKELFQTCPDLTHVALDSCPNLTDDAIITLARSCPNLKHLSMTDNINSRNRNVGDASLFEIIRYSINLEHLNFLFNRSITSVGIVSLFRAMDHNLKSLSSLSFCVGKGYGCSFAVIMSWGFPYLTERCKQRLKDSPSFTEPKVASTLHLECRKRK